MKYLVLTLCFCFLLGLPQLHSEELPEGFVDLKAVIPDIHLEIRYFTRENFVGEQIDGYEAPRCILTKPAAEALRNAQAELKPFGLSLKVYDGYRPQRAVQHFVRWAKDVDDTRNKAKYYPDVEKKHLFRDGYIAEKSSHSRGSAVDVTIVSLDPEDPSDPEELDMGTPWDFFGPQSWPGYAELTDAQRAHRMLLQMVMVKHGFAFLEEEWWHFALEDEPYPDTYFDFPVQ